MIKAIVRILVPLILLSLACSVLQKVSNPGIGSTPAAGTPDLTQAGENAATALSTPQPSSTSTPTPTLTATSAVICPNAPPTRLKVGDQAQVTVNKGLPTRLRREPIASDNKYIKLLTDGTNFEIIDGPECATVPDTGQGYVFWKIRLPDDGLTGWVAEGDASGYFIEPIP
jgi:hypothetical protein